MRRFVDKKTVLLLGALVLLALGALAALRLRPRPAGGQARLTFAGGATYTIPLGQDARLSFDDGVLPVTVQVANGRVRFVDSVCPDHLCEGFGWLFRQGQTAICLPAGAFLEIFTDEREKI